MPEGKTVTIQHLSSEQAQQTATDTQLPDTSSGGGGIGGWISQHRMMLLIVGGGAILGIIIYFYIKNQNAQTQAASTTDTGSPTDGTTTVPGTSSGAPDLSPLENLMNQLQQQQDLTNQDLAQILAAEQGEPTSSSGGGCPHDMHKCGKSGPPNNGCCCNKKNMNNKGTHCEPKGKKGGAEDHAFALGGSDMFNDMFSVREPFRNTGHRMIYAMGGADIAPINYHQPEQPLRQIPNNRFGRHFGGSSMNTGKRPLSSSHWYSASEVSSMRAEALQDLKAGEFTTWKPWSKGKEQ